MEEAPLLTGSIAVLGGTGSLGAALAGRWAAAGLEVVLGSRDAERAAAAAAQIAQDIAPIVGHAPPKGAGNVLAARNAHVAVLAVPYTAQGLILDACRPELEGKLLVTTVVPLDPTDLGAWRPPLPGSAAAEAQAVLGAATPVVTAFQNVSATSLASLDRTIENDVLVCGDDDQAKRVAIGLIGSAGLRAFDAGPLANAAVVEGLTAVLIGLNRRYGGHDAGVRVLGLSTRRRP